MKEAHMHTRPPIIVVVGSLNIDLVVRAARRPQRGETLTGDSFGTFVGGKGLNQAIAAARLGAQAGMVGRVGADDFGHTLLRALADEGIAAAHVARDAETSSGVALIIVDAEGDNSIVIVPGANGRVSVEDIEQAAATIAAADAVLLQLETPLAAVERAAVFAHNAGVRVLLNPAPAQPLSETLLHLVDVIVPNESEAQLLTGISIVDDETAERAAWALLARGARAVVLTLGARGALLVEPAGIERIPGYRVPVVDTTAAGDAFCGALAVRLAAGASLAAAARYANAAGALAVTAAGAAPSLPRTKEIAALLAH